MSLENHNHKEKINLFSNSEITPANFLKEEELDPNDLEVAMINESFEEQMKQSQFYYDSNLKSIFYGEALLDEEKAKTKQPVETDKVKQDVNMNMTPLQFISRITAHSTDINDENERGRQLDMELERMMLEEDENRLISDSPLLDETTDNFRQPMSYYNISSVTILPEFNNNFMLIESKVDDCDSRDCADAAEAIAMNMVASLFEDDVNSADLDVDEDDEDKSMVISNSILQLLQEDEDLLEYIDGSNENTKLNTPNPKSSFNEVNLFDDDGQMAPSSRNDSIRSVSSPMSTTDEQTVPVIDSWEELAKEPQAAKKAYNEARAALRKMRNEKRAAEL